MGTDSVYLQCEDTETGKRWRHLVPKAEAQASADNIRAALPNVVITIEWEKRSKALDRKWREVYNGR